MCHTAQNRRLLILKASPTLDWPALSSDDCQVAPHLTSMHLLSPFQTNHSTITIASMDDPDSMEVDPALAAAMGFSGFGTQPQNKKRKFNTNEGFVDPEIGKSGSKGKWKDATGANEIPVGKPKPKPVTRSVGGEDGQGAGVGTAFDAGIATSAAGGEKPSLEALRHGVVNERGDVAYFLPSFLEDPWKGLMAQ